MAELPFQQQVHINLRCPKEIRLDAFYKHNLKLACVGVDFFQCTYPDQNKLKLFFTTTEAEENMEQTLSYLFNLGFTKWEETEN